MEQNSTSGSYIAQPLRVLRLAAEDIECMIKNLHNENMQLKSSNAELISAVKNLTEYPDTGFTKHRILSLGKATEVRGGSPEDCAINFAQSCYQEGINDVRCKINSAILQAENLEQNFMRSKLSIDDIHALVIGLKEI